MSKGFSHRDKWFTTEGYEHLIPAEWTQEQLDEDPQMTRMDDHIMTHLSNMIVYISNEDKAYEISPSDVLRYRKMYNGHWHVSRQWFKDYPIDADLRRRINEYECGKTKTVKRW